MGKGRLEAFSDGVIAIIITIMVLELWNCIAFVGDCLLYLDAHTCKSSWSGVCAINGDR
jgi:hypothetical protein